MLVFNCRRVRCSDQWAIYLNLNSKIIIFQNKWIFIYERLKLPIQQLGTHINSIFQTIITQYFILDKCRLKYKADSLIFFKSKRNFWDPDISFSSIKFLITEKLFYFLRTFYYFCDYQEKWLVIWNKVGNYFRLPRQYRFLVNRRSVSLS